VAVLCDLFYFMDMELNGLVLKIDVVWEREFVLVWRQFT